MTKKVYNIIFKRFFVLTAFKIIIALFIYFKFLDDRVEDDEQAREMKISLYCYNSTALARARLTWVQSLINYPAIIV